CGMSPEVRKRLFSPFFTTKPVGRGMGLGLSICYGIVKSLGGTIEVDSKVDVGSIFRVVLPAARRTERQAASVRPPPVAIRAEPARVLVIDDEAQVGRAIRRTLEPHHRVTWVGSPREALARLRSGERFDVILCDIIMPDMTGMELFEVLRSDYPECA